MLRLVVVDSAASASRFVNSVSLCQRSAHEVHSEADQEIASLANCYKCPVTSSDNDFFIFDIQAGFIPFDYLIWRHSRKERIEATIYHREAFLMHLGLKPDLLPLLASIIGSDYVSPSMLTSIQSEIENSMPRGLKRIEYTAQFLRKFSSVEEATRAVVSLAREKDKEDLKKALYMSIDSYRIPPRSPLLDFLTDSNASAVTGNKSVDDPSDGASSSVVGAGGGSSSVVGAGGASSSVVGAGGGSSSVVGAGGGSSSVVGAGGASTSDVGANGNNNASVLPVPTWVLENHRNGSFPSYYISNLMTNVALLQIQVQNIQQKSANYCTFTLRQAIYAIVLGQGEKINEYIRDGETYKIQEHTIKARNGFDLPSLSTIPTLSLDQRMEIMMELLESNTSFMRSIEYEFLLFAAATRFWLLNADPPISNDELNAILFTHLRLRRIAEDGKTRSPRRVNEIQFNVDRLHSFAQWQAVMHEAISLAQVLDLLHLEPAIRSLFSGIMAFDMLQPKGVLSDADREVHQDLRKAIVEGSHLNYL
ncbi:protein asteroid homolog 1-like isoform X2 [Nematostella vectensis]|uniref:protein asteroid homolog 1-like isoform X2 n=1 Tax=Nematostella vectensis TaxID=45351 RepID=UPI002076D6AF|nr:protein asteroid homolog 1-like isoform X2 [Nematostella vectensis]